MLTRYAIERLLYRLSVSAWSNEFLLKGALLFDLWFDQPQRPTRDIGMEASTVTVVLTAARRGDGFLATVAG